MKVITPSFQMSLSTFVPNDEYKIIFQYESYLYLVILAGFPYIYIEAHVKKFF